MKICLSCATIQKDEHEKCLHCGHTALKEYDKPNVPREQNFDAMTKPLGKRGARFK